MKEPVIEVRNLWTRFGRQVVHRDVSLTVYRGEIISLVGGSGSGKTVLMRQILGLEKPARGEVNVFGRRLHDSDRTAMRELRERWGVLFQEGALFSALNVYDNVAVPLRELKTVDETLIRDLVMMKLDMVSIEGRHAYKMPAELSGGMVKRVALARALALEPELLFLDEPTAGLDPDRSESFVELLQGLHRELDLTVVMITHDLETLAALSDRVAVLADQKLVAASSVPEVLSMDHPFIRNFFQGERGRHALETWTDRNREPAAPAPSPAEQESA